MTSLIDVIFLLLLFFMLSSTFSKFAEVELTAASAGTPISPNDQDVYFLRLTENDITLNGQLATVEGLRDQVAAPATVIVSLTGTVTSQALTDVLVGLRQIPDLSVSVIGSG